jgi:aryl-alcohol dehydrogenase-like predicted oxidoreductase
MIPRRTFGASGAALPVLGFGVSGPHATGLVPRNLTARLVRQALDAGASLFDTAPFYGDGEAEARLGAALSGARDAAFICTKVGTVRTPGDLAKDFTPAHIVASAEASLKRLNTDRIDALLLHGPSAQDLNDDVIGALETLRQAGKLRFIGVCGRGPELEAAIASRRFDLIMAPAGPSVAKPALARAAAARAAGMGVLGIEIMARSAPVWRMPLHPADFWYLARSARRQVRRPSGPRAAPASSGPLQDLEWALAGEACDTALVTTTRPAHLAANIAIAQRAA